MKIGIIGCGYVGEAAARFWASLGHFVSVTTRSTDRIQFLSQIVPSVHHLKHNSLPQFMEDLDRLLICVAPDASSTYSSTYLETAKLVVNGLKSSESLTQILYTSSTSVYGDHQGNTVDETSQTLPLNERSNILLETENCLLEASSPKLSVCIYRLGEIYGPGREIEERLKRRIGHPFPGTGSSHTNLIHLEDIVRALDFAVQHNLNGVYNLCNDLHLSRASFYAALCEKNNLPAIHWDPNQTSPHGGDRIVSNKKIKGEGFTFNHPTFFPVR